MSRIRRRGGGKMRELLKDVFNLILAILIAAFACFVLVSFQHCVSHMTFKGPSSSHICSLNLKKINNAMVYYAEANDGRYPESFYELYEKGYLDIKNLICPEGRLNKRDIPKGKLTRTQFERIVEQSSYVYNAKGETVDIDPEAVMVYERQFNHGNRKGMVILRGDGSISLYYQKRAMEVLKEQGLDSSLLHVGEK